MLNLAVVVQDLYLNMGGLELQACEIIKYLKQFYNVYVFSNAHDDRIIHYENVLSVSNVNKLKGILQHLNVNCVLAMFSWKDIELWYRVAQKSNIKLFYSEHNDPDLIKQRMSPVIRRQVLLNSALVRVQLDIYKETPNSVVIPNFVNSVDTKYDTNNTDVLFVGDIDNKIKNFELLHNAFINQPYGRLFVCGKTKKRSSDRLQYLGVLPDISEIYKKVGIVVIPSLYEGISNTLLEAMSFGIPTIVNAKCRSTKLLSNGLVFDGTEKDLTLKIKELLSDSSLRTSISSSCNVEQYNPLRILPKWKEAVQKCMET